MSRDRDRATERALSDVDRDRALDDLGRLALERPEIAAATHTIDAGVDPVVVLSRLAVYHAARLKAFETLSLERARFAPPAPIVLCAKCGRGLGLVE